MSSARPTVSRIYQNHSLDSTRWRCYEPGDRDVIVASSYKSGTTWVQHIVLQLLDDGHGVQPIPERSPWVESPLLPVDDLRRMLNVASGRRVLKTHLPLDGLPFHDDARYIVVCRDPRDVFMSLWNHYRHLIRWPFHRMLNHPGRVGPPLPRCPPDVRLFWRQWITTGWFPWEREGYPFWANLGHTRTWWEWRHLPNVHFVHFNQLSADLPGAIKSIAAHVGVDRDEFRAATITRASEFRAMKAVSSRLLPDAHKMLRGGADRFLHRGTSAQWVEVLENEDLALYRETADRALTVDCVRWLEGMAPCVR